jgi:hypothetical protein
MEKHAEGHWKSSFVAMTAALFGFNKIIMRR